MAEPTEDFERRKKRLIDTAAAQVEGLRRWQGGSLRFEAFRVRDTMDDLIALVDEAALTGRTEAGEGQP